MKIPIFVNNVNIDILKQRELDGLDFTADHPCEPAAQSAEQWVSRLLNSKK